MKVSVFSRIAACHSFVYSSVGAGNVLGREQFSSSWRSRVQMKDQFSQVIWHVFDITCTLAYNTCVNSFGNKNVLSLQTYFYSPGNSEKYTDLDSGHPNRGYDHNYDDIDLTMTSSAGHQGVKAGSSLASLEFPESNVTTIPFIP